MKKHPLAWFQTASLTGFVGTELNRFYVWDETPQGTVTCTKENYVNLFNSQSSQTTPYGKDEVFRYTKYIDN